MKYICETEGLNRLKKDHRITYDLLNHYVFEYGYPEVLIIFGITVKKFKELYCI